MMALPTARSRTMATTPSRETYVTPATANLSGSRSPSLRRLHRIPPANSARLETASSGDTLLRNRAVVHQSDALPPGKVNVIRDAIAAAAERRLRRRVPVRPMYSFAIVRVLSQRAAPIEAYVLDISENGMAIEADTLVNVGEAITVEFRIAGVGQLRNEEWPEFAVAGVVVRHDDLDDFPQGPYRMALRFAQLPTMTQAQIARYVATQV